MKARVAAHTERGAVSKPFGSPHPLKRGSCCGSKAAALCAPHLTLWGCLHNFAPPGARQSPRGGPAAPRLPSGYLPSSLPALFLAKGLNSVKAEGNPPLPTGQTVTLRQGAPHPQPATSLARLGVGGRLSTRTGRRLDGEEREAGRSRRRRRCTLWCNGRSGGVRRTALAGPVWRLPRARCRRRKVRAEALVSQGEQWLSEGGADIEGAIPPPPKMKRDPRANGSPRLRGSGTILPAGGCGAGRHHRGN